MSNAQSRPITCPPRAILRAIARCDLRCNPAVVETPKFTVHVRKLHEDPATHTFVINIIEKIKIK